MKLFKGIFKVLFVLALLGVIAYEVIPLYDCYDFKYVSVGRFFIYRDVYATSYEELVYLSIFSFGVSLISVISVILLWGKGSIITTCVLPIAVIPHVVGPIVVVCSLVVRLFLRRCYYCKKYNLVGNSKCKHCGKYKKRTKNFGNTNHEAFFMIAFIALASIEVIKFFATAGILNINPILFFLNSLGIELKTDIDGFIDIAFTIPKIIYFLAIIFYVTYIAVVIKYVFFYCKEKGYSAWTWLFIVVFTPYYIGVILYVLFVFRIELITFVKNTINEVKVTKATRTLCKHCGESIDIDFKVCPYCSTENE